MELLLRAGSPLPTTGEGQGEGSNTTRKFKLTPDQVVKLSFADIACGSGSFLIEVYNELIRFHELYYTQHPDKAKKGDTETRDGKIILSLKKRQEILTNNIYGVDIDYQATEVTQLSLYLKLLEDVTLSQTHMFKDKILPDLRNNIVCGNSLIGRDILEGDLFDLPAEGTRAEFSLHARIPSPLAGEGKGEGIFKKLKPMDFTNAFPDVMKRGGFDAVVGNPPYVRPHNLEDHVKEYLWAHFQTFVKKSDLYCCFMQRAVELTKNNGLISYIVSDGWLRLDSFEKIREFVLSECQVLKLVELPQKVFEQATVETGIFLFAKNSLVKERIFADTEVIHFNEVSKTFDLKRKIRQDIFLSTYKNVFDTSLSPQIHELKAKLRNRSVPLGSLLNVQFGLKTGDDKKFLSNKKTTEKHKPLLRGDDVSRYGFDFKGEYVWYVPEKMKKNKSTARPGDSQRFEQPKILIKDTSSRLGGTLDLENYYVKDVLLLTAKENSNTSLHFMTGILNSSLMRFYYESTFPTLHVQNDELSSLPIRTIDFTNPEDKSHHDKMVKLVDDMLKAKKELAEANMEQDIQRLERECAALDRQIDQLVYELYGLTEEEIQIVEGR